LARSWRLRLGARPVRPSGPERQNHEPPRCSRRKSAPRAARLPCGQPRGAVSLEGCLHMDGRGQPGVAVSEPNLGGLHVATGHNQSRGRRATTVVRPRSFTVGRFGCREPHPPAPGVVANRLPGRACEDKRLLVFDQQISHSKMPSKQAHQRIGQGYRAVPGGGSCARDRGATPG